MQMNLKKKSMGGYVHNRVEGRTYYRIQTVEAKNLIGGWEG